MADWSEASLRRLAAAARSHDYDDGAVIASTGDAPTGVWLVQSGCVETSRVWSAGGRLISDFLEPGRMTGFVATIDGLPVVYNVVARGPVTVLFIPAAVFNDCLRTDPKAAWAMLQMMSRRTRMDYERVELLTLNGMRARIAKVLLYLARGRIGRVVGDCTLVVSQEDLGGLLGATRQSINGELRWFIASGILSRRYRGLVVEDANKLFAVAFSDEPMSEAARQAIEGPSPEYFPASD